MSDVKGRNVDVDDGPGSVGMEWKESFVGGRLID